MVVSFSAKAGSLEGLKCRQRWGLIPWPFQIPGTAKAAIPTALAIARSVQWVASCDSGACVRWMISATNSGATGAFPGGRDGPRSRPSPLRRTIQARRTCFWGLLGPETIACKCRRPLAETVEVMPLRMRQTRVPHSKAESQSRTLLFRSFHSVSVGRRFALSCQFAGFEFGELAGKNAYRRPPPY